MILDKSPETISSMFDALAQKYDLMNDLMTGFTHRRTRKFAVSLACFQKDMIALDLATGTGDLALLLHATGGTDTKVIGIDFSRGMLAIARKRAKHKNFKNSSIVFLE
ncbi:MAG: class I SAM-dependent methyltransferase, partial [Candidatus Hodarchaeales archaeon]